MEQSYWKERYKKTRNKRRDQDNEYWSQRAKTQNRKRWEDHYQNDEKIRKVEEIREKTNEGNSNGNSSDRKEVTHETKQDMLSLYHCAEALKQRLRVVCIEKALYIYNGRSYDRIDVNQLLQCYRDNVDRKLHGVKTMSSMKSLYEFLLTDSEIQRKVDYEKISDLAVLKNGVFDVRNQTLLQHSAKYMFMYHINADYVEDIDTPVFDEFLDTVTGGDKILIKRMWYLIAYLCMHSVDAKAFFVLGIAPNSGKSVFGKFIQHLFDDRYVSSISLNDMSKEFSLAQIVGKAINVSMDLPSTTLNAAAVSRLKMITGDDLITINEKYMPQFRYYNRAKFLFASNHPVHIGERDDAFWNRMIYFPFNISIPNEEQDKRLLYKILDEKNAIVSKALRYGKKFVKNNYIFPSTSEIDEIISVWKGERDYSIENFLRDCCQFDEQFLGEWNADLFEAYEKYCFRNGRKSVSSLLFRRVMIELLGREPAKFRKKVSDNPRHGFSGIKLINPND